MRFAGDLGGDPGGDPGGSGDLGGDPVGDPVVDPGGDLGGDPGGDLGGDPVGDLGGDPGGDLGGNPGGDLGGNPGGDLGGVLGGDLGGVPGGDPGSNLGGDLGGDPVGDPGGSRGGEPSLAPCFHGYVPNGVASRDWDTMSGPKPQVRDTMTDDPAEIAKIARGIAEKILAGSATDCTNRPRCLDRYVDCCSTMDCPTDGLNTLDKTGTSPWADSAATPSFWTSVPRLALIPRHFLQPPISRSPRRASASVDRCSW